MKNLLSNKPILCLLALALLVQMLTAWQTFFFHSDEYFQIIEFASYKLGLTPKSMLTWEFREQIRPTIQPYLFSWLYQLLNGMGITNRFFAFSVMHVLVGLLGFFLTNYLIISRFKEASYLFILLLLNNFIGIIPFLRCSFSAETMGGLLLLLSLLLMEADFNSKKNRFFISLTTGLLMAFSFFFRFQIAFALLGVLVWLAFNQLQEWKKIAFVAVGFAAGMALNVYLDSAFYDKFCFTPYNYFYANIIQGKAAAFGTSPWWYYLPILAALAVPLLSVLLFALFAKGLLTIKNVFSLAILFFIIGHSMVGHKEERFLFPVMFFMVYLAAIAYQNSESWATLFRKWWKHSVGGKLIKAGIGFSVIINLLLVVLLCLEPYKQPVKFIKVLNASKVSTINPIICYRQSPYTTESNLEYHFLCENKYSFVIYNDKGAFLSALDSVKNKTASYYAIKYEDAMNDGLVDLVPSKHHGIVSAGFIWRFANWLGFNYKIYIPDIWLVNNIPTHESH